MSENSLSININIPKPRFYWKPPLKVLKNKNIERVPRRSIRKPPLSLKMYTLPGIQPVPVDTFKRGELLIPYKLYSKKQEKERFKQRLIIKATESYKIISNDLKKRLHIDDPPNDCHAIADIDPDFFQCVNGSILSKFVPQYKSLKYIFSSQLRLRQEVGYKNDCILNIACNHRKEQEIYNNSIRRYKDHVKYFDNFISSDYQTSMEFLRNWDKIKIKVSKKITELQHLATEKFTITSRLVGLDYRYGQQQKYGRFLYYLSPPSWRSQNRNFARSVEIEAKGFDFGNSSEDDTFNVIFDKLKKLCSGGLIQPALYFEHPNDLMKIFESIEQQQLYNFTHVSRLTTHTKSLKKGIKHLKELISQDSAGILNTIKDFQNLLDFYEEQSSQLESRFYKILNGLFYNSVGAPDVLKLHKHLEFCFESVYNEKPMNMEMVVTAKSIEHLYMDYSKRLDAFTSDKTKHALKQCIEFERKKYKRAKLAAKELRLFERLERALLRACASVEVSTSAAITAQPTKLDTTHRLYSRPKIEDNSRKSLTEAEEEYLTLFTDWTHKEDPAKYLQSLTLSSDN